MLNKIEKKKKHIEIKDLLFYIALLALPIVQICLFYIYVNFNSVFLAFKSYEKIDAADGTTLWMYTFVGLDNFGKVLKDLFTDSVLVTSMLNSFKVFGLSFLFGVCLASIFSYYIFRQFKFSGVFRVLLFLPQVISSVIMVILFKYFAEELVPEIALKLFGVTMKGLLENANTEFISIVLYSVFIAYGSQVLLYTGAMAEINDSVLEAGQIDGVNPVREFLHIIFPAIWPTFTTLTIVAIAGIFSNGINLYTLYGNKAKYSLYTMGYYMFFRTSIASYADYPYLATLGVCFTLILFPVALGVRKFMQKFGPSVD